MKRDAGLAMDLHCIDSITDSFMSEFKNKTSFIHEEHSTKLTKFVGKMFYTLGSHWLLLSRTGIRLYLLSKGTFSLYPSCQI